MDLLTLAELRVWTRQAIPDGDEFAEAVISAASLKVLDECGNPEEWSTLNLVPAMVRMIAVQLAKLESHPVAGPALADGRVQATGLFYDIATARVVLVRQAGIEFLDPEQAAKMSAAHAPAR